MTEFTVLKPRLLLLSDIWVATNCEWIQHYIAILDPHFDIQYYDVCKLAEIDDKNSSIENVHNQFTNGGIDRAVNNLLAKETAVFAFMGFSIGGLIAWKAVSSGLKCSTLFAISSTRLRYESLKPDVKLKLLYGSLDAFMPDSVWFEEMELQPILYQNELHEMYRKKEIAVEIAAEIINHKNSNPRI